MKYELMFYPSNAEDASLVITDDYNGSVVVLNRDEIEAMLLYIESESNNFPTDA
jgi:hypothetical protein